MSQPPRQAIHLPKVRMLSRGGRLSSGLRITNVKSIKPPDPEIVKKQEKERLRAEVQDEIVSRSRTCAYKGYECTLPVLSGRQYCYKHILRDPTAPYRQCAHIYNNGDRCQNPAPDEQRDPRDPGLCFEHARAVLRARQRSAAPPRPVITTETLLNQLQHYVKPERPRTTSCASSVSVVSDPAEPEPLTPQHVDPYKQVDAAAMNAAYSSSIMEYESCSDSDADSVLLGAGGDCRAEDVDDMSDAEDAPCEQHSLWRAGVFTAEEAICEAKNMLRVLQSAYLKQMDRLRVLLQTARLQYLRNLKAEKEQYCSINTQMNAGKLTPRERRLLKKLKAFASYHKHHGIEAVLARKLHHKRAKVYDTCQNRPIPSQGRCVFTEGGVRCPQHVLPASKHCLKHILHDRQQVLFAACGDTRGVTACQEPIPKLPLPSASCRYHTDPPPYTVFAIKKEGSDTESEPRSISEADSHRTEVNEEVVHTDHSVDDRQDIGEVTLPPETPYE
ncbi:KAT8 regulatory NSL complex subunit dim gamma-tubulin 1 isoform X2 [Anticarsia gemmatalis]